MTPGDRALLDAFQTGREDLLRAAADVPPRLRGMPFVGHWHLGHLLAHLVGWDYANVEAVEALSAGRLPAFYTHYEPDWATFNATLVACHDTEDWLSLRAALRASLAAALVAFQSLEAPFSSYAAPWDGRSVTIAGILRAAIRDEREHLAQVRALQSQSSRPTAES